MSAWRRHSRPYRKAPESATFASAFWPFSAACRVGLNACLGGLGVNPISETAFALLEKHRSGETTLTRGAGSFCGELITDPRPLTDKQKSWLDKLVEKAGLSPIGEAH